MTKYWTLFNYLEFEMPAEAVAECHHQGSCDSDVEYWQRQLALNLDRDAMVKELSEYGAWELEELEAQPNDALEMKLIWLAAGDIQNSDEYQE